MPTKSKAQQAAEATILDIQEKAKAVMAVGVNHLFAQEEAFAAYRALNALAEKIRASVPVRGKRVKTDGDLLLGVRVDPLTGTAAVTERQEGGE